MIYTLFKLRSFLSQGSNIDLPLSDSFLISDSILSIRLT